MKTSAAAYPSIVLVRAEYLLLYLDWLRKLGTPVDRELRKARLPTLIEELPDEYVSLNMSYRFLGNCARIDGVDDIGFEAGWNVSFDAFGDIMASTLRAAPTPKLRLEVFARLLALEDTGAHCEAHFEGDMSRISVHQYTPPGGDSRIAEWLNIKAIIEIIRTWMGQNWMPPVIGLESRLPVLNSILNRLPGVQVLTGQSAPFIRVPNHILTSPITYDSLAPTANGIDEPLGTPGSVVQATGDIVEMLSTSLSPYLRSGYPQIDLAAEIAGISVRSLQRQLGKMRISYTELVERIRYGQAIRLLADPDLKILEIALALGYGDASNFSRAFRRISGSSPREIRKHLVTDAESRGGVK